jgi:hypothetical protein
VIHNENNKNQKTSTPLSPKEKINGLFMHMLEHFIGLKK